MQIISIGGEKIASLAEPFEIKLDEPPLSSAGLFAITGETGAGKSSLLDAMCLALYGNCPRLSGDGTRENVEDVDGQELKSNDPRMALRRGAVKATARVVFRAVDGEVYAAEWMVRRAREKLDGRLQNVERSLTRVTDGKVLATQTTIVTERVVELTGLSYDEFRRTVLLAQGDFDAFLLAKTADRAAILEKVTGTGIYRHISEKVYERYVTARRELETLVARRGEHRLLTPEEFQELDDAIKTLRIKKHAEDEDLTRIRAEINAFEAFKNAQEKLERAELRVATAHTALEARAGEMAWLVEWEAARALRVEVKEWDEAIKANEDAIKTRDVLVNQRNTQVGVVNTVSEAAATARSKRDEAEKIFKAFAGDWTRATTLDASITTATNEVLQAEEQLKIALDQAAIARQTSQELSNQKDAIETAIVTENSKLEKFPGYETFLRSWSLLEGGLQDRIASANELAGWLQEKTSLAESIATDREKVSNCAIEIEKARLLIEEAREKQNGIAAERAALIEANHADVLARLSQAAIDLRDLRNASNDAREARNGIALSDKRISDALHEQEKAATTLDAAKKKAEDASLKIDALRRPVESADAAVTREAAYLRKHLSDGEPCPVCQSTTHPVMQDNVLAELARSLRESFEEAVGIQQKALDDAQAAERAEGDAKRIIAEATLARRGLETRLVTAIEAFRKAWRLLEIGPLSGKLPDDPEIPDAAFVSLFEHVEVWRGKLEADWNRLSALEKTHVEAGRTIDDQTREITRQQGVEREIVGRISGSETRIAALDSDIASALKKISQIDARIRPILAEIGQVVEKFGAGSEDRLEKLRRVFSVLSATRERIDKNRSALADLGPEIGRVDAVLSGAVKAESNAVKIRDGRVAALKALIDERALLLGGEATDTHRTRHNEARMRTQAALEQADLIHSDENAKLSAVKSRLEAAESIVASTEARLSTAGATLLAACSTASLSLERVTELLLTPDEKIAQIRESIRQAEEEKAKADGALKEHQDTLKALLEKGLPEKPRHELEAQKSELEKTVAARGEDLGRLAERQSADAEARTRLEDLEKEIVAAQGVADTWLPINEAIGSANGDRFAQIAQAVTLGLLVERANLHLQELKPRYRLEVAASELALHVIDLDMAGELRTTRSLSGGERFLVSLALALALSNMGTHGALAGTLFIDEGFGSLDSDSLDLAIDALERLQAEGRTIGVISHVQAMKDRIPVQVEVIKAGGGASQVRLKVA
jgi:exonuclease SbcC